MCFFLSVVLRPVECGAYSSGVSRKEKEIKTQRPLRLERAQRVGGEQKCKLLHAPGSNSGFELFMIELLIKEILS